MGVWISYDPNLDEATIRLSDERQSYDEGQTQMVQVRDDTGPEPLTIDVQLGFEGNRRLMWVSVHPASVALSAELLASAEKTVE